MQQFLAAIVILMVRSGHSYDRRRSLTPVADSSHTGALAAHREAGRVEGTLELGRAFQPMAQSTSIRGRMFNLLTVRAEVDRAIHDRASSIVGDPHRQIVPINKGDCAISPLDFGSHIDPTGVLTIVAIFTVHAERKLGESGRRNALRCASIMRVCQGLRGGASPAVDSTYRTRAFESAVAAAIETRVGTWDSVVEVTVPTSLPKRSALPYTCIGMMIPTDPDAPSLPIVGHGERDCLVSVLLPSSKTSSRRGK